MSIIQRYESGERAGLTDYAECIAFGSNDQREDLRRLRRSVRTTARWVTANTDIDPWHAEPSCRKDKVIDEDEGSGRGTIRSTVLVLCHPG